MNKFTLTPLMLISITAIGAMIIVILELEMEDEFMDMAKIAVLGYLEWISDKDRAEQERAPTDQDRQFSSDHLGKNVRDSSENLANLV